MKRASYVAYLAVVALLCLAPSLGLLLGGAEDAPRENAAPAPAVFDEEGAFNVHIMSDAGAWFDDHFAFRSEWVTAAARLAGVFGVSTSESVVRGEDGWLYYADSVEDFQGIHQLNDRQLFDIAHSLKLVQTYALSQGASFAFALAPNKNTLYGEHMPYYLQVRTGQSNLDRIKAFLESEGVNYVDLQAVLEASDEVLYHERDSHWDNRGAALVSDAILEALGKQHRDYSDEPYAVRRDFAGDLETMLHPAAPELEDEYYFKAAPLFEYATDGVESNFDPKIETVSAGAGSLVMYRDSFCNSLLPFMAEAFGQAYFSRGIPYQLVIDVPTHQADAVVVERAQRFMRNMAANAPMIPAPLAPDDVAASVEFSPLEDVDELRQGDYLRVSGLLGERELAFDARIAIRVNGSLVYEAFGISDEETGEEGFQVLVPVSILMDDGNRYEVGIW